MENFFVRYKNPLVLMAVLLIQVVALATQVKRQENGRAAGGGTRLIRVWTVTAFTPVEKIFVSTGHFFRDGWHNYVDLRNVRKQNKDLQDEVARLQMEQARLRQDADQAKRLQTVLDFKERYVARTIAAQVIGTSGTEQSRIIIVDKGAHDGIKPDMAVITPDGIVGKVKEVFPLSSQVLLISDHDSGAGAILENTRLQGIVKGSPSGELQINDVMSDEKVEAGEHVITSGGDRIFPKGLSVGTVISATPDRDNDPFLNIRVKPAADLRRLEEVLVVIKMAEEAPVPSGTGPIRAADILSQRLPSIPKQEDKAAKTAGSSPTPTPGPAGGVNQTKPAATNQDQNKAAATAGSANVTPAGAAPAKSPSPSGKVPSNSPSPLPSGKVPSNSPSPATNAATKSNASGAGTGTNGNGKPASTPPAGTGTSSSPKPATTAPAGNNAPSPTKPATEVKKPAVAGQPPSASGTATPTPTPKPKATPPKNPQSPTATGAPPGTPDKKNSQHTVTPPSPTPTPTPEREPR
ncbi:MAG TPA: rod shape-determining protein MreC [Candidatus Angelobacter sp.]|jgi:rod shape-determining protein MreC